MLHHAVALSPISLCLERVRRYSPTELRWLQVMVEPPEDGEAASKPEPSTSAKGSAKAQGPKGEPAEVDEKTARLLSQTPPLEPMGLQADSTEVRCCGAGGWWAAKQGQARPMAQ